MDEIVTEEVKNAGQELDVERILQGASRHHFAFLRAYLEGLNLSVIARRYLESATSPRVSIRETMQTLQWIRQDLSALAKRHGKFAYARVINLDPEQLQSTKTVSAVPTLEQFREERDPYEMYSEADLIELFQEEFGSQTANPKQERNGRLVKKQVEALSWLEGLVWVTPTVNDPVDAWLVPAIASRLMNVGIVTISSLLSCINGKGHLWYRDIPQIGAKASARIIKWITIYEKELGQKVGLQALAKRSDLSPEAIGQTRAREHGIVPFEYFQPRPELDGSQGENRGLRNKSGVDNDYEAIYLWLRQVEDNPSTFRSYRKEAERFLLWSLLERGKPISSLMTEDCLAYRNFLRDLGRLDGKAWASVYKIPQEQWIGRRGTQRWSSLWRPFENPVKKQKKGSKTHASAAHPGEESAIDVLGTLAIDVPKNGVLLPSSQKLAHTILKSMCEFLMRQRYLDFNPWDGVKPPRFHFELNASRSFTVAQWEFIQQHLAAQDRDAQYHRLKFILDLAYGTGMRISEIAHARLPDIREVTLAVDNSAGWIIKVIGKGDVPREVAMNSALVRSLSDYLAHRGIAHVGDNWPDVPLVDVIPGIQYINPRTKERRDDNLNLSVNRINEVLKTFFQSAAREMAKQSLADARHMMKASTHWLRHTCGSHAAASGVDVQVIQSQFGHKSINTTSIYVTTERDTKIREFEKLVGVGKS